MYAMPRVDVCSDGKLIHDPWFCSKWL